MLVAPVDPGVTGVHAGAYAEASSLPARSGLQMTSKRPSAADTPGKIVWLLPVLSVIWLAVELWAARGQIRSSGGGTVAIATAADALPGVVQATIVAGIGLALLVTSSVVRSATPVLRWVASGLAGAVIGAAVGGLVSATYPHLPSIGAIAAALVIAGVIGGVLVPIPRIAHAVAGGLAGTLGALAIITIVNSNAVLSRMLNMYGAGTSAASYIDASKLVQYTQYALAGIVAGLIAFAYLRRAGVRLFPIYLLAGALPGMLLLVAFGLTSAGGHHLLSAANGLSEADRIVNGMESAETVPNALLVLFVGAFSALIAFGRTLKSAVAAAPSKPARDPAPAQRVHD
jgi:hypothetical protein